jgi:hypothetical protein
VGRKISAIEAVDLHYEQAEEERRRAAELDLATNYRKLPRSIILPVLVFVVVSAISWVAGSRHATFRILAGCPLLQDFC